MTTSAKTMDNKDWAAMLTAVNVIKNPRVKDFVHGFLMKRVPDYFARIPASASGKYHPEYSQGYGGLIRHTLAAAAIGKDISQLAYLRLSPGDQDLIYSALLLHDTFKQGRFESGTTERAHPNIAAQEILAYGKEVGEEKISQLIAGLVVSHMGEWGNQKPGNRGQFLVHLADYLASRKYITINWDHLLVATQGN